MNSDLLFALKGFIFNFWVINRKAYKIIRRRIILHENLSIYYESIGKKRKLSTVNNFRRKLPDNLHQNLICQYATTAPVQYHRLPAPVCRRLPVSGLRQILSDKHRTAPVLRPFQSFGLFRSGAVTLSRPLPFPDFFFCWRNHQKNTAMLYQKHINRPYRSEGLLLRGKHTINFAPKIYCMKTD